MNKESSDEKLLKLIEGTAKAPQLSKIGIKPKNKKPAFSLPSLFKLRFKPNLYGVNKALFVTGALLTFIFLYSFISDSRLAATDLVFPAGSSPVFKANGEGKVLSIEEYQNAFNKRNIFLSAGKKASGLDEKTKEMVKLADLLKDLKLVGVIWSASPEVMIEDALDKRTYLLKKGETFSQNQYKVKEITRTFVILEVEMAGEKKEYELR